MKQSITLESNLLYLFIEHPDLIDSTDVEEKDFGFSDSKAIFSILKDMRFKSKEINLATIDAEISKKEIKTSLFLECLRPETTQMGSYDDYCMQLKELSVARELDELLSSSDNPNTIIEKAKKLQEKLQVKRAMSLGDAFIQYEKEYKERKAKGGMIGVLTGFDIIDMEAPLEPSTFTVLAARPSIGKSAMALTIARNAAEYGHNVLFVSAEMSIMRLLDRLLAMLSNISSKRLKMGQADGTLQALKADIARLDGKLRFVYLPYCTSQDVYRLAAKENAKKKVDLVIVDYIQYLRDSKGKNDNESTRVANITRNLKGLAGSCECAVLALSQVNRQAAMNEGGLPELYQLRDSGSIEQDADTVLILNREGIKDTIGELIIAKNRNGEPGIRIPLTFNPETTEYKAPSMPRHVENISLPYKDA